MKPSSHEEPSPSDCRSKLRNVTAAADHRRRAGGPRKKVNFVLDDAKELNRVIRMEKERDLDDDVALNEAFERNRIECMKIEQELADNIEKRIDLEKAQLPTYATQDPDFEEKWWAKRRVEQRAGPATGAAAQLNFFDEVEELRTPPAAAEPEFYETEVTLDTGAAVHAADCMDFPGHEVKEGAGSRAGQRFQAAGD